MYIIHISKYKYILKHILVESNSEILWLIKSSRHVLSGFKEGGTAAISQIFFLWKVGYLVNSGKY